MFLKQSVQPEFPPVSGEIRPIDIDLEDRNSVRGKKLRNARYKIKAKVKVWIFWTLILIMLSIFMVSKYDKDCPSY